MGNCTSATLAGLAQDCSASMGGISKVLIAPWDMSGITVESGKTHIYSLTASTTDGPWKAYYFRKGNASATSTLTIDPQNGVNYVSTAVELTFTKQETTKRIEVGALATGSLMLCYKDANGKWWFLGYNNPVEATEGSAQTGAAKTDGNFYRITLGADEETFPMELDDATSSSADLVAYPD